jgi:hypothetical protein
LNTFNYEVDKVTGLAHPAKYPGEKADKWAIPDDIRTDFGKLNSVIETKYTREYLKVCAFYNKMFPSLKTNTWIRSSYNVPPFTVMDQERQDTGTGISSNYLKQITDQIVSRIGTVTFEPQLIADMPTLEYIVYKDEVERLMRKIIRDDGINQMVLGVFHDAAVLGYSHVIIDPVTHVLFKANDYEVGFYESQFNKGRVQQLLYRDYAYPVSQIAPYVLEEDKETVMRMIENEGNKSTVDFKMYFDCPARKVHVTINGTTLSPIDYPFEDVQMVTFCWDTGFSRVTSTSLFDLLYPMQREINKMNAKMQQMIRMYKGPVPVFNADADLAMKAISNGGGEALYVDGSRQIADVITVINPTPLDPQMSAVIQEHKTAMYEIAGIQQMSFDMENMRSAAAVIAMDQTRDTVFQSQMQGIAAFVKEVFKMIVYYNATRGDSAEDVPWEAVKNLMDSAAVELKPVHLNDPLSSKMNSEQPPDYRQIQTARLVVQVLKGELAWNELDYMCDRELLKAITAITMVKLDAFGILISDNMHQFMLDAFVDDIRNNKASLLPIPIQAQAAMQAQQEGTDNGAQEPVPEETQ